MPVLSVRAVRFGIGASFKRRRQIERLACGLRLHTQFVPLPPFGIGLGTGFSMALLATLLAALLAAFFALFLFQWFQVLSPEVVCGNHDERQDLHYRVDGCGKREGRNGDSCRDC